MIRNYTIYRLLKEGTRSKHPKGKIGITCDIERRLGQHFYGSSYDINEGFEWELLDYVPNATLSEAMMRERQWQSKYGVIDWYTTDRCKGLLDKTGTSKSSSEKQNHSKGALAAFGKLADVYLNDELIARDVYLSEWCRENRNKGVLSTTKMYETARGVRKAYKGYRAVYKKHSQT